MAKSSISIKAPTPHSTAHNCREVAPSYLIIWIDEKEKNQVNEFIQFPKNGLTSRDEILEYAKMRYKEKNNQSMQQNQVNNFWKEGIVNIKKNHTSEDIKKLFLKYNEELSIEKKVTKKGNAPKSIQRDVNLFIQEIAVHKDEGIFVDTKHDVENIHYNHESKLWFDLDGNNITHEVIAYRPNRDVFYNEENKNWYTSRKFEEKFDSDNMQIYFNYHAHVTFTQFDFDTCKSARLDARDMVTMQDITARELDMERGGKTRYTDKQIKEIQEKLKPFDDYENSKEYGKEFNRVARELGYLKPKKSQYKHHTQLKDEAEAQDYNFRDMQKQISAFEELTTEQKRELHQLNSKVKNDKATIKELETKILELQQPKLSIKEELLKEVHELKVEVKALGLEFNVPKHQGNQEAEEKSTEEEEIKKLRYEIKTLSSKISNFINTEKTFKELQTEIKTRDSVINALKIQNSTLNEELVKKEQGIDFKPNMSDLEAENKKLKIEVSKYRKFFNELSKELGCNKTLESIAIALDTVILQSKKYIASVKNIISNPNKEPEYKLNKTPDEIQAEQKAHVTKYK